MPRLRKTKKTEETAACTGCHSGACTAHLFSLKPVNGDPCNKLAISLEFCPKPTSLQKKPQSIVPLLNRDGKQYTPCFILEGDEAHYREFESRYKDAHNLKLIEYEDSNKTILEPKHGRKSKICAVCRIEYLDYRDHIATVSHKQRIRSNTYNGYIDELARTFSLQEANIVDTMDSIDYCESTKQSFEQDVFITKRVKRENQTSEKELERSLTKWTRHGDFIDTHKSSPFEKGRDSKLIEADWEKNVNQQKSFHVEDYLRFE